MSDISDIASGRWSRSGQVRLRLGAYAELTKARIAGLVLLTTFAGFQLGCEAAGLSVSIPLLAHALFGTALVVAGANVLNQCLEVEHDRKMKRTMNRPLPSGRLMPGEAVAFGMVAGAFGVFHLLLWVNGTASALAAVALVSYVAVYTPLKRVTSGCVLVGAIPGALPPVIGWAATGAPLTFEAWLLFGIMFFWQLPHFAAIAWQYRDDYGRAGYPMLPVVDCDGVRTNLHVVTHSVALLVVSLLPVMYGFAGLTYAVAALVLGIGFLVSGVLFLARRTQTSARVQVLASIVYLPTLLVFMLLDVR